MKTDQTTHHRRRRGFTLIELSVVLVVIALLAGGIMVGRDMIRSAQIRQFVSQKDQVVQSVQTFRVKYNCLPGDCPNATDFFGTDPEGCNNVLDKTPKTQTCNGNGDGSIDDALSSETWTFWQHLSAAGLWSGLFRGGQLSFPILWDSKSAPNPPLTSDAIYVVNNAKNYTSYMLSARPWENHFISYQYLLSAMSSGCIFRPREMQEVDNKYDDGSPASGKIQMDNLQSTCITVSGVNSTYLTSSTSGRCIPFFPNVF